MENVASLFLTPVVDSTMQGMMDGYEDASDAGARGCFPFVDQHRFVDFIGMLLMTTTMVPVQCDAQWMHIYHNGTSEKSPHTPLERVEMLLQVHHLVC